MDITIDLINNWLASPDVYSFLFPFKILAFIVTILFLCGINYYFFKQRFLVKQTEDDWKGFLNPQGLSEKESILKRWDEIRALVSKEEQIAYKTAMIKAANLFYDVLEKSRLVEKDIEKITVQELRYIEQVRELLEIADDIREDPSFVIDLGKMKNLLVFLGESLDDLGVI